MKTYLAVPFKDKEKAKNLGAKFDLVRKQWYVPDGVDLAKFLRWLPGVKVSKTIRQTLRQRV